MNIDKKLILDACFDKQNELIEGFKTRLVAMETDAFDQDHSPSQTENRAPGKIELLNAIGSELEFAKRELELLKSLSTEATTKVEPGAVVVTNKMTFYICVSIEQFEVKGQPFFGISTKAPIYASMRGLEEGAYFSFNETQYHIKNIY